MLEIKGLSKTYKTSKGVKTAALDDISLNLSDKGMVFILGKSGSGKSTLLNVLGGLDSYDSGEIIINGKSTKKFKQSEFDSYRNTYIGFIFQEFNIIEDFTINKNIALALQLQQKKADPQVIEDLLKRVDLEGYGERYPSELSGGQKQRVAIARALVKSPEIIMADEPTGALDSSTGEQIFGALKELSKEKLVLVVSHDRDSAEKYADRIIELKDGKVISDSNEVSNDQAEEEKNNNFHLIKSHLPMSDAFKLGITSLKHKKIRMVFSIILTVFALTLLGLSDGISSFDEVKAHIKALSDNNQQVVAIMKSEKDSVFGISTKQLPLSDNEVKQISDTAKGNIVKGYQINNEGNLLTVESMGIVDNSTNKTPTYYRLYGNSIELLEISNFDQINIKDFLGRAPTKDNEIAISSFLADHILYSGIGDYKPKSYQQILDDGHTISLDGFKDVKIVGIAKYDLSKYDEFKNKTIDLNNIDFNSSDDASKKIKDFYNDTEGTERIYVTNGFVDALKVPQNTTLEDDILKTTVNGVDTVIRNIAGYKAQTEYFNGKDIVKLDKINDDEIILNIADCLKIAKGADYKDPTAKSKEFENLQDYIADAIIGKTITLSSLSEDESTSGLLKDAKDTKKVKVIGVIPEDSFDKTLLSMNIVSPLASPSKPLYSVYVSTTDKEILNSVLTKYPATGEIYSNTRFTSDISLCAKFSDALSKVFLYLSLGLLLFAILLTTNFIVTSVSFRKKEIGILRAIGARSADVLKIFIWEGISLSAISFAVTMVPMFWLANFINNAIITQMNLSTEFIIMSARQPILLLLVLAVVTFISSLIPIIKVTKQKPIDTIKK